MKIKLADNEGLSVVLSSGQTVTLPRTSGALALNADVHDATTLTPLRFLEWTLTANNQDVPFDFSEYTGGRWRFVSDNPDAPLDVSCEGPENAAYLEWIYNDQTWRARRMALGYQLSTQEDKPLASEAEAEALRTAVAAKYTKPTGGIPATDLSASVQASLSKADTALQAHQQLNNRRAALQWSISVSSGSFYGLTIEWDSSSEKWVLKNDGEVACYDGMGNAESLSLQWPAADNMLGVDVSATRQVAGWVLGTQDDKPLATAAQGAKADSALPAANVVAPSTASSNSGKAADAKATGDALAQKVDKPTSQLTPATKCKVTYDENGLVTAGADLEPEDVPALPYMPAGAHVRRVWADDDSSTVDAEGVMRSTSLAVSKWTKVGGGSTTVMDFLDLYNGNYYWGSWSSGMLYTPSDGKLYWRYGSSWPDKTQIKQDLAGKDPTLDSCTFDTFTVDLNGQATKFTFTPAQLVETEGMIARFALESIPDHTIEASATYNVGDLLGDDSNAYRCISAYTSAVPPVALSADSAHWTEIPVLAQKADAAELSYVLGSTISASTMLADRTNNYVEPAASNADDIVLNFPAKTVGRARDFLVVIVNTVGNTGSFSFTKPDGAVYYGDGLSSMPASGETWLYSITEIADNKFYTKAQQLQEAN